MAEETPDAAGVHRYKLEEAHLIPGRHLASYFCNEYHVLLGPDFTRLAFGNNVLGEQDAVFHAVVTMPTWKAVALAHLIISIAEGLAAPEESHAEPT